MAISSTPSLATNLNCFKPMNLLVILAIIMSLRFVSVSGLDRHLEFVPESYLYAGYRKYVVLKKPSTATSMVQCGVKCSVNPDCAKFIYNATRLECILCGASNQSTIAYGNPAIPRSIVDAYVIKNECDATYVRQVNKCLEFHPTAKVSREIAQQVCNSHGRRLVEFSTLQTFQFVRGVIVSTPSLSADSYWTGAVKSISGSFWWESNQQLIDNGMWARGQPDGFGGPGELCTDMHGSFDFYLNDISCSETAAYMCE